FSSGREAGNCLRVQLSPLASSAGDKKTSVGASSHSKNKRDCQRPQGTGFRTSVGRRRQHQKRGDSLFAESFSFIFASHSAASSTTRKCRRIKFERSADNGKCPVI